MFDSKIEEYFNMYLQELKDNNIIKEFSSNCTPITLNEGLVETAIIKHRVETKTLIKPKLYTPDFFVIWNKDNPDIFKFIKHPKDNTKFSSDLPFYNNTNYPYFQGKYVSLIETKGVFDNANMTRAVKYALSIIWDKHNIFIDLIKVPDIFQFTFTPERYKLTDSGKQKRKINYKPILSLEEYLKK